jgi:hypothetical protein
MATSYTSLLGLALPVQGELSGTWGNEVNNYITNYVDAAVAGTQLISGSQTAVALSVTNGASLSQAAAGATGSAQYQIIRCSGNPASLLTITAPAASKVYLIINATSTAQSVKIVGVGPTTGVTIATGKGALVAWNGSDFVTVASNDASVITGVLAAANGGTGQSSYAVGDILYASGSTALSKLADVATGNALISGGVGVAPSYGKIGLTTHVSGTLPVANGGTGATTLTANNVILGNGTSAPLFVAPGTNGNVLTSNGTTWVSSAGVSVSAATPTALGTVYGQTNTANPKQTFLGYQAGNSTTGNQNTFVGWQAGFANTSGTENTSIGESSFKANTTGSNNTVVGTEALRTNTTGSGNVALGQSAMGLNTTGISNVAVGLNAINANTTGNYNVAVGRLALTANTTADNNTAVGYNSLSANTTGTSNTAMGSVALQNNTTGSNNSAFGWYAMILNSTGGSNTASGVFSMYANTTGSSNTAYGYQSLYTNTVNGNNTAIGRSALQNSAADNNTAVGHSAGLAVTTGEQNTLIGRAAGNSGTNNLTTGSNNILLGYNSAASSASVSNEVTLGNASITKLRVPGLSVDWAVDDVPFRNIPQNAQTGSYTLVLGDSGKHIYHASGAGAATYTIPANGSVAYPIGTAVTFINLSSTSISIAITTDTMYLSSAGTTGTRTLAQYGSATAIKVDTTTWMISGSGLT